MGEQVDSSQPTPPLSVLLAEDHPDTLTTNMGHILPRRGQM